MARCVALLRGINVGGKNKVAMADLRSIFIDEGCTAVGTYIQSGNVVFETSASRARSLAASIEGRLQSDLDLAVPVLVRTAKEIVAAAEQHPFADKTDDHKLLHVGFLKERPSAAAAASIDPGRSPGDEFAVEGQQVFFYFPKGIGRTKLTTDYLDRRLGTTITVRNLRTVKKLAALAQR